MQIQEEVLLAPYTTFGIGGAAKYFCEAEDEADVVEAVRVAKERGVRLFVLGGGSNLLVADGGFDGLVLRIRMMGVEMKREGALTVFDVGAGEEWDAFVLRSVTEECAGLECLAGIPGTVGGTPVQNVGAYGQEVSETILSVRVLDLEIGEFLEMGRDECGFRYRQSVFNSTAAGRYVVTRVRFGLVTGGPPKIAYADLRKHFGAKGVPSLREVYDGVRAIRNAKGMLLVEGEADCRSAGSFFKNPIVEESVVERVAEAVGLPPLAVPRYPSGKRYVKLPAAWLLERAGFVKGFAMGRAGISSKHTLALVNLGGATAGEVQALRDAVIAGVEGKFGIRLEQEPVEVQ